MKDKERGQGIQADSILLVCVFLMPGREDEKWAGRGVDILVKLDSG